MQAFNLYWLTTSGVQLIILNLFRSDRFRRILGIPQYLPGSKLERLNTKVHNVAPGTVQAKIMSGKPKSTKQKAVKAKRVL